MNRRPLNCLSYHKNKVFFNIRINDRSTKETLDYTLQRIDDVIVSIDRVCIWVTRTRKADSLTRDDKKRMYELSNEGLLQVMKRTHIGRVVVYPFVFNQKQGHEIRKALKESKLHTLSLLRGLISVFALHDIVQAINQIEDRDFTLEIRETEFILEHIESMLQIQCARLQLQFYTRYSCPLSTLCSFQFLAVNHLELEFSYDFDVKQATVFLQALGTNRFITKLNLHCSTLFEVTEPSSISALFTSETITDLTLYKTKIDTRHLVVITECLKTNTRLQELTISDSRIFLNGIPPEWFSFLDALQGNTTLNNIDMSYIADLKCREQLTPKQRRKARCFLLPTIEPYFMNRRHNVIFTYYYSLERLRKNREHIDKLLSSKYRQKRIEEQNEQLHIHDHIIHNRVQRAMTLIKALLLQEILEEDKAFFNVNKREIDSFFS